MPVPAINYNECVIDVDGGYYKLTHLYNDTTFPQSSFASARCLYKGDFIPIYQKWQEYYGSSASEGQYVSIYNSFTHATFYVLGMVLLLCDIETTDGKLIACVVHKTDTQMRSLATRQDEIVNGYNYQSTIKVFFYQLTPNSGSDYDYTKFKYYDDGSTQYFWYPNKGAENVSDSYSGDLLGTPWTNDGAGTMLGCTLLIPFHWYEGDDLDHHEFGFILGFKNPNSSLIPAGSFVDIVESEDTQDFMEYVQSWSGTPPAGMCLFKTYSASTTSYYNSLGINPFYDFKSGFNPPSPPPDYPFEDDYNGGGGGTGDYSDTSDTIPVDGTPTNSAIASGFVNAYLLTQQNVNDFHAYLYSTDFLTNVKKLMNDPIDYILAFMLAPYTPDTSAAVNITIGGTDSEVAASRISSGYKTVDCGTITLSEFWGKFYDYNPYTKIQIYLPFIGMRPLDVDDVMAGEVNLKYRIDVLTGACVATVSVNNARGTNGAVYNFNGNCHSHIPISGKNYLETVTNVISAGVGMAGSIASGNALGVATGAINVMRSAKEQLEHAGELTGAAGLLANYTPFLMVSRPSQSLAQNYNHYKGFISNVTAQLGTLTGYTEVAELVQTDIHCTLDEFDEINELLKEGVYL